MATDHRQQQFFSVSKKSAQKIDEKNRCRQQALRQTVSFVQGSCGAIWLILTVLLYVLLLTGLIPCSHLPRSAWAEARDAKADVPLPSAVTRTLTVASSNPNSGVSITVAPNDLLGLGNGTTQFTRTYNNNARVTLTAPSTAGGNNFEKWQRNGVDYATTPQITVVMGADYTLTAVYVKPTVTWTLTVASSNPNSGASITVSPNDNSSQGNGTTQFTRIYNDNTVVTLTAPSTAGGNNFQKWQRNGVDYATTPQTTVTMDANYTMTAIYVTPAVTQTLSVTSANPDSGVPITVSPNDLTGLGSGTTPFTRTYINKTVVTLTAPSTAGGNNFVMWYRNGSPYSSESQISITADAWYNMKAHYEPATPTWTLTVISSNPNGWDDGAVITITPDDKNAQGSGTTSLVRYYSNNTMVTLIPTWFVEGNNFLYWEINGVPYVDSIVATVTMEMDYILIAHYAPPTVGINFALYGQESVTIGKGSSISGGAVGVAMTGEISASKGRAMSRGADQYRVEIKGARIDGDVYGDTVYLGRGTRVQNVFANHLTNDKGRYKSLAPLPDSLPRVLPLTGGNPGGDAILVPAKGRVALGQHQTDVRVEPGGTAVLSGGRYEFETLELGKGGRLMVQAPSFLVVNRILDIGEKCFVGPSDKKLALNLTIIVRGTDKTRVAAVLGESSKIQAAIRVPSGTLQIRHKVKAKGSFYASILEVGEGVSIGSPSWDDTPEKDPQCLQRRCRSVGHQIICQILVAEGASCDDGNACTIGDVCTAEGYCKSGNPITDPNPYGNPCVRDICDPVSGIYKPLGTVCDTNFQCSEPTMCDGHGVCAILGAPFPQGTPCDDGIPNNGIDQCTSYGKCKGPLGPYDCKANTCSADASSPPDLTCWLNTHPGIRDQIVWFNPAQVHWADWTIAQKQELEQAFLDTWDWFAGGMTNFQGTPIPEPPPNSLTLADNDGAVTVFSEETAWQFYLAEVAHSLAIEIGHWVPWSLCDYSIDVIDSLLSGPQNYHWTGNYIDWNLPPGYIPGWDVTPAHPTVTYSFLYQNGLIGSTRYDTIAKLLDWGHNLRHFAGGWDTANIYAHWQYRGLPPVSRTIEGTEAPNYPYFGHWTAGCHGTDEFLKDVLKSVNIPVQQLTACWHATPYFPSEGLYLSHGDDPYDFFREGGTTVFPQLGEILIDQATYLNWFTGTPEYVCGNVGRRPAELALQLLPDFLVTYYCSDVAANTPHDSGSVYDAFNYSFTLQELEDADLWGRLCLRAIELGTCTCE